MSNTCLLPLLIDAQSCIVGVCLVLAQALFFFQDCQLFVEVIVSYLFKSLSKTFNIILLPF